MKLLKDLSGKTCMIKIYIHIVKLNEFKDVFQDPPKGFSPLKGY